MFLRHLPLLIVFMYAAFSVSGQAYYFETAQIPNAGTLTIASTMELSNGDRIHISTESATAPVDFFVIRESASGQVQWLKRFQTGQSPSWERLYLRKAALSASDTVVYLLLGTALVSSDYTYFVKIGTTNGYVHYIKAFNSNSTPGGFIHELPNGDVMAGICQGGTLAPHVLKYDINGNLLWSKTINGLGGYRDLAGQVTESNGTITFLSRHFDGSSYDLVALNIDTSANINWSYLIAGSGDQFCHQILRVGNRYYLGFGESATSNNYVYLMKCDLAFNVLKTIRWRSSSNSYGAWMESIIAAPGGNILVSAADNGLDGNTTNGHESLVMLLDTTLNVLWKKNTSTCVNSSSNAKGTQLYARQILQNGKAILTGITRMYCGAYTEMDMNGNESCLFANTTNLTLDSIGGFSPSVFPLTVSPSTMVDLTIPVTSVVALNAPANRSVICPLISPVACFSYTSPSGINVWNTSGFYKDTIPGGGFLNVCDSIILINLTVNTVNLSVTNQSPVLISNASGASYQWVDCNNNFAVITGATGQSFTAQSNGSYAVIVTQNSCSDTSACVPVSNVGLPEQDPGSSLLFYPNPAGSELLVTLSSGSEIQKVIIRDMAGRTMLEVAGADQVRLKISLEEISGGIYNMEVISSNGSFTGKVIRIPEK